MVDRHPRASIYCHRAIGLGRDELKWEPLVHMGNYDGNRYGLALDSPAFVKQYTDGQMTMHHRTPGYFTGDHSFDGDADPSAIPSPIPTDGLLFKLAVCIGGLNERLFGGRCA